MSEELKPCPFCGTTFLGVQPSGWWVWCENCGAEGPANKHARDEAITAWNRRANEGEVEKND